MESVPLLRMGTQETLQQASRALFPKAITNLLQKLTKQRDKAPQDRAVAARQSHDDDADAAAAPQFRRFPDLPTELRLLIWAEATRYKRYVVVVPPCNNAAGCLSLAIGWMRHQRSEAAAGGGHGECPPAWTSRTPPPPLLSVSREAREVALRTWRLAFGMSPFPPAVVRNPAQENPFPPSS